MRVALLVLVLSAAVICDVPWSYCPNTGGDSVSVSSTPIVPYPIVKGKPVSFEIVGTAKKDIHQKNARMDVYEGSVKIFSTSVGGSYNTGSGQGYDYKFGYSIPSFVPPGDYVIHISSIDTSGNAFVCVQLSMHF